MRHNSHEYDPENDLPGPAWSGSRSDRPHVEIPLQHSGKQSVFPACTQIPKRDDGDGSFFMRVVLSTPEDVDVDLTALHGSIDEFRCKVQSGLYSLEAQ